MPFVSQAQRGFFHKAKSDQAFAKKHGLSSKTIDDFIAHDQPGKLPSHVKAGKIMRGMATARRKLRKKE